MEKRNLIDLDWRNLDDPPPEDEQPQDEEENEDEPQDDEGDADEDVDSDNSDESGDSDHDGGDDGDGGSEQNDDSDAEGGDGDEGGEDGGEDDTDADEGGGDSEDGEDDTDGEGEGDGGEGEDGDEGGEDGGESEDGSDGDGGEDGGEGDGEDGDADGKGDGGEGEGEGGEDGGDADGNGGQPGQGQPGGGSGGGNPDYFDGDDDDEWEPDPYGDPDHPVDVAEVDDTDGDTSDAFDSFKGFDEPDPVEADPFEQMMRQFDADAKSAADEEGITREDLGESTYSGQGRGNYTSFSLRNDESEKHLANALARTIGRVAEAPTGVPIEGDEEWDLDRLMIRRYTGRNLRNCRQGVEKTQVIFLMDTSPSCRHTSELFAKIATMTAERGDCEVYACPNGTIDGRWNPHERRWEAVDMTEYNVPADRPREGWYGGYQWVFKGRKIVFFGDFDGEACIRNSAERNDVYWFNNQRGGRKYEWDGYEYDIDREVPHWWKKDRWFRATSAEDVVRSAQEIK